MLKNLLATGLSLLLSIGISLPFNVPEENWKYLNAQTPGSRSAIAYSLGGQDIREEIEPKLKQQFKTWEKTGFISAYEYETALLSLIKLQKNSTDYRNADLLSNLFPMEALSADGLDGITGALLVYSASGLEVTQSQPNSPNSLIDRVMAAQQRSGGFASAAGENPNVAITARAITSLFPYQSSGADVKSTVERAIEWLGNEQNADGTFSVKGLPSGTATAEVLMAVSLYEPESAIVKSISKALNQFKNTDGGYSEILGGISSVETTELVIISQYTAKTGNFPFYAPQHYPEYVKDEPVTETELSPFAVYGKFVIGFSLIFFIVYLLLIITIKFGKFAERKKLPGSLAAQEELDKKNSLDETISMNIPMQAEIPNFDDIPEHESEIGHSENKL